MPTLKQLICTIELCDGDKLSPVPEFGTTYGDGIVITHVPIPTCPLPFAIRLTSSHYIAEGLAAFLFMDGDHQCNRNKTGLKPGKGVDFLLRQREDGLGNGRFLARDWTFDRFNIGMLFFKHSREKLTCSFIVPKGETPEDTDFEHFRHLGTIQIVVVRCTEKPESKAFGTPSGSFTDDNPNNDNKSETENVIVHAPRGSLDKERSSASQQYATVLRPTAEDVSSSEDIDLQAFGGLFDGAGDAPGNMPNHFHERPYNDIYYSDRDWYEHCAPPLVSFRMGTSSHGYERDKNHAMPPSLRWFDGNGGARWDGGAYCGPRLDHRSHFHGGDPRTADPSQPCDKMYPSVDWRPSHQSRAYSYMRPREDETFHPNCQLHHEGARYQAKCSCPVHDKWLHFQGQSQERGFPGGNNPPNRWNSHGRTSPLARWNENGQMPTYQAQTRPSFQPRPPGGWTGARLNDHQGSFYNHPTGTLHNELSPELQANRQDDNAMFQDTDTLSHQNGANSAHEQYQRNSQSNGLQNQWNTTSQRNLPAEHPAWGDPNAAGVESNGARDSTPNDIGWEVNDQSQQNSNQDNNQPWSGDNTAQRNAATWYNGDPTNNQADADNEDWEARETADNKNQQDPFHSFPQNMSNRDETIPGRRALRGPKGVWYGPQSSSQPRAGSEPAYDVPEEVADNIESKYQIKAGKGYMYYHQTKRPLYIDTMDEPYAIFTFKYLNKEVLERVLNVKASPEVEPPPPEEQAAKLQEMSREDLIRMILKQQDDNSATPSRPGSVVEPLNPDTEYKTVKASDLKFLDIPAGLNIQGLPLPRHVQGGTTVTGQDNGAGWNAGNDGKNNNFGDSTNNNEGGGSWDNGQGVGSGNNGGGKQWASNDQQKQGSDNNWNDQDDGEQDEPESGGLSNERNNDNGQQTNQGGWEDAAGGWDSNHRSDNAGNSWSQRPNQSSQEYNTPWNQPQQNATHNFPTAQGNNNNGGWPNYSPGGPQHPGPPPPANNNSNWPAYGHGGGGAPTQYGNNSGWQTDRSSGPPQPPPPGPPPASQANASAWQPTYNNPTSMRVPPPPPQQPYNQPPHNTPYASSGNVSETDSALSAKTMEMVRKMHQERKLPQNPNVNHNRDQYQGGGGYGQNGHGQAYGQGAGGNVYQQGGTGGRGGGGAGGWNQGGQQQQQQGGWNNGGGEVGGGAEPSREW